MLRSGRDMKVEERENMRGGQGKVRITHIFKEEELTGKARLTAKIALEPGASIGLHAHEDEEEIFYILTGTGQVQDGEETYVVEPGDGLLTGGGSSHAVFNTGEKPLEMLAVILTF